MPEPTPTSSPPPPAAAAGPVLELAEATVEAASSTYEAAIWNVTFRLLAGELMLVRLEKEHLRLPLADAAEGLVEPVEGDVRFRGESWRAMSPALATARRGRIGRVFAEQGGWVSGL